IWQNEHGEQDGDEINVLDIHGEAAGSNYGWPVATYAVDYGDASEIGDLPPERPDTVAPVHWWEYGEEGGFPPSGLAFVTGAAFSAWEGDILMGNLADQYLGRFEIDGEDVLEEHRLLEDRGWRVRAVDVHPSTGEIYALVDSDAAPLVRLYPQ
ncbi:MAG: PQQ-dependent sugar dehydrogenase, partial [Spirochaetia bacterium]